MRLLIAEDEDLTMDTRLYIAQLLQRLYFTDTHAYLVKYNFALSVQSLKDLLQQSPGLSATKAEEEIAKGLGVEVDALRKRLQRHGSKAKRRKRH
jgi:hypothetical protein